MTHSIKTQGHGERNRTMIKINKFRIKNYEGGYTIVELLFYIAFFAVFSLIVTNAIIIMSKSFRETTIQSELARSGMIMERISREVRQVYEINSISEGIIKLNSLDSSSGGEQIVEFSLADGDIALKNNGALVGNLNAPNIEVVALDFTEISTAKGKAVKVMITVKSDNDVAGRAVDFYDTIALRGGY